MKNATRYIASKNPRDKEREICGGEEEEEEEEEEEDISRALLFRFSLSLERHE